MLLKDADDRVNTRCEAGFALIGSNIEEPKMTKRSSKPRLHKASGRAFIELDGRRIYLEATYGTRAAQEEYDRLYGQWLANGKKPPPSKVTENTGLTVVALAIHYLNEMEEYHAQQRRTYTLARQ